MAVKQHAIVSEFELETEKSDPDRFRGKCSANGCPWKIEQRHSDKSVGYYTNYLIVVKLYIMLYALILFT